VTEIVIYNLVEGIFYSKLICEREGQVTEIDARTSDAIAIGVRFNCPIYTFESILSSAGILMDENQEKDNEDFIIEEELEKASEGSMGSYTIEELEVQLGEAIENEDYELASRIRDEINKRTSN
jgi:bifunctional DNase/RNase